jgi:hypothetical protein
MLLQRKLMRPWPPPLMRMRPPLLAVGPLAALPIANLNPACSQAEHFESRIHQLDHQRSLQQSCKHIEPQSQDSPVSSLYRRGDAGDQRGCDALWASGLLAQCSYVIKS